MIGSNPNLDTGSLCTEMWGGTGSIRQMVNLPGLECVVDAVVYKNQSAGGDLYHLAT